MLFQSSSDHDYANLGQEGVLGIDEASCWLLTWLEIEMLLPRKDVYANVVGSKMGTLVHSDDLRDDSLRVDFNGMLSYQGLGGYFAFSESLQAPIALH